MERPFTVVCLRDEQIVHIEETELVWLRGLELERIGDDGYLETIAAYDVGPNSWYGYANCDRYDKITVTVPPTRRLLVDLLDEQNRVVATRELSKTRGLRLDSSNGPRLLFISDDNDLADSHADSATGIWRPSTKARLGFTDKMRFKTPSLFETTGSAGPRLRPSALAERLAV